MPNATDSGTCWIAGAPDDPRLPQKADLVLLVDVYRHIAERERYFSKLAGYLKRGGRVAIIDFRMDSPDGPPKAARLAPERVKAERKAGATNSSRNMDSCRSSFFHIPADRAISAAREPIWRQGKLYY